MKYKNHMIISVDVEKAFKRLQQPSMIKVLNKLDPEEKLTTNFILSSEN